MYVETLIEYSQSLSFDDFKKHSKDYDACCMKLINIGEVWNRILEFFKNEIPNEFSSFPFEEMRAVRNRIAHDYVGLNDEIIWNIIKDDFPNLEVITKDLIKNYSI